MGITKGVDETHHSWSEDEGSPPPPMPRSEWDEPQKHGRQKRGSRQNKAIRSHTVGLCYQFVLINSKLFLQICQSMAKSICTQIFDFLGAT